MSGTTSALNSTVHTITNITTAGGKDTITLSSGLVAYNRARTGCIILYKSTINAIEIVRVSGTGRIVIQNSRPSFIALSGIDMLYVYFSCSLVADIRLNK